MSSRSDPLQQMSGETTGKAGRRIKRVSAGPRRWLLQVLAFPLEDEECETGDSITGYVDIAQNAGIDVGYEERITGSVSRGGSR